MGQIIGVEHLKIMIARNSNHILIPMDSRQGTTYILGIYNITSFSINF